MWSEAGAGKKSLATGNLKNKKSYFEIYFKKIIQKRKQHLRQVILFLFSFVDIMLHYLILARTVFSRVQQHYFRCSYFLKKIIVKKNNYNSFFNFLEMLNFNSEIINLKTPKKKKSIINL